jgi:thiol-disulfide isomerase/thioredoxin
MRLVISPLLGTLLLLGACDRQSASPAQPGNSANAATESAPKEESSGRVDIAERGSAMPDVTFEGPNGEAVTLANFKGKPLLVNLWATWCGPCVAEMPTLDKLARRELERLQVIVVSQDSQGRELVAPWWAKRSFDLLKPYIDPKSDLGFAFNTGMVPTTVLYDKDGKEVWRVIGSMDWDGPRANTLMAETLGG